MTTQNNNTVPLTVPVVGQTTMQAIYNPIAVGGGGMGYAGAVGVPLNPGIQNGGYYVNNNAVGFGGGGIGQGVAQLNGQISLNTYQYQNSYAAGASDIHINDGNGGSIKVGESIKALMDIFGIMLPDRKLMSENPALKEAYDDYILEFKKTFQSPELQSAIENYKIVESLVKDTDFNK